MSTEPQGKSIVAVIGAGPAGLFAARALAAEGVHVVLINRDIKPGGLAEYGIYFTKHKMKEGLRKQFRLIMQEPLIDYYGNLSVGNEADLTLDELRSAGLQAFLVAAGAQGTKWLGLPGEELTGVYHAKDLVYHYNKLPPYSEQPFIIGRRVALVGVGNVMLDIARWLIREKKVDEVVAVARRGPAEVKFDKKEMESVVANLDQKALDAEMERVRPVMEAIGQDVQAAKDFILSALAKAKEPVSEARFFFDFLASPTRILGDESGKVTGLEVEETVLVLREDGDTKARGSGVKRVLDVDTVIFCIGDKVDETFGLPVKWNEFVKNPEPRFPADGVTYEAYDPDAARPIPDVFVAGWSREASSGLVGVARKDGETGARIVLQYLQTLPSPADVHAVQENFKSLIKKIAKPIVTKEDILRLEETERAEAERHMLEEFKFGTNEEMLAAMGLAQVAS